MREKQQVYWDVFTEFMAALAASVNLLFYLILTGMLDVAAGKTAALPSRALWLGLGVMAVILIFFTRRLVTMPKRLVKGEDF
jgi:peptidoglycan biosynthesis protein MviN/MurJ (putative lipid II flippase)